MIQMQTETQPAAETLSVGDETVKIPTIKMGTGGLTLAEGINLVTGAVADVASQIHQ